MTFIAVGIAMAPAIGATDPDIRAAKRISTAARSLGNFTPASADPRLAAAFARSGLDTGAFRFTPSETRRGNRAVTVAVRAQSTRVAQDVGRIGLVTAPIVGIAPIAYNLGAAVGWKRFAVSGDLARIDLAAQPGSREAVDLSASYAASKFTGRVKAASDRPLAGGPRLVEDAPSQSLDLGGSYSLSRNIDLTAGVRYKSERERLARLQDDRRDSQAVYVGTAFRF